ncbi:MAG: acyloxyacyl hydrolase [Alphaproteobacteria bacterium]
MFARFAAACAALCLVAVFGPVPARADDDPSFVTFQAGALDLLQNHNKAGAFAMEYRDNSTFWIFKPFFGAMGTTDGAAHGYGGVLVDIYLWRRIVFTLSFAPGLYHDGKGVQLGFPLEFRSAGELAYRFDDRSRLGFMINHISNASLGKRNPGTEVMMLSYSVPFTSMLGGKGSK